MHDKHIGTDKVLYGSTIDRLINEVMPNSVEENLRLVMAGVNEDYKGRGVPLQERFTSIRLGMISQNGAVKLKGKAAEVKSLAHPLHTVWKKYSVRPTVLGLFMPRLPYIVLTWVLSFYIFYMYTTFSLLYWDANNVLHQKIELCLRTSARLEDMMTDHKDAWVFPGLFFFNVKNRHIDVE